MSTRLRRLRNPLVWWFDEMGQSGMEPSHRPGHRFYRPGPDEEVRNDEWRKRRSYAVSEMTRAGITAG
jgi:hypothetical protein